MGSKLPSSFALWSFLLLILIRVVLPLLLLYYGLFAELNPDSLIDVASRLRNASDIGCIGYQYLSPLTHTPCRLIFDTPEWRRAINPLSAVAATDAATVLDLQLCLALLVHDLPGVAIKVLDALEGLSQLAHKRVISQFSHSARKFSC